MFGTVMAIGHRKERRHLRRWLQLGFVLWLVAVLLLPSASVFAQTGIEPPAAEVPVIKIGVGAMLAFDDNGNPDPYGWGIANAVQLAIDETNAAGGVRIQGVRHNLKLLAENDNCNYNSTGKAVATEFVAKGVAAVVGHECSGASMDAEGVYYDVGVPMITPSATAPFLTGQGHNTTFRLATPDGVPSRLAAAYLRELGSSRAAVVWGVFAGPFELFRDAYTSLGGTVVADYQLTGSDFSGVVQSLRNQNVDAVYFCGVWEKPEEAAAELFTQLRAAGVTATFAWERMENDETGLDKFVESVAPLSPRGTVAAMTFRRFSDMPGWDGFLRKYRAANFDVSGQDPTVAGVYAYDAARMVIAAIRTAQSTNPRAIRDALAATRNFKGAVGTYDYFAANGEVVPQWAWLERYNNTPWQIVK
jgi:branched-chain amino acid transport system substrate-binding protein